jgi:hypothetical protein
MLLLILGYLLTILHLLELRNYIFENDAFTFTNNSLRGLLIERCQALSVESIPLSEQCE